MISRRRNLFVILLMAGLLLASLVVIITKETRLGLDLKGGVELVYQGEPTPQTKVTPEAVDRSIDIIRERVDQLGVGEPEIQRIGSDQISVGLPGVKNLARAKKQVGTTAQLYFYDWEQNVIGNPQTPLPSLYDAVKKASGRKPQVDDNNTTGAAVLPVQEAGPHARRRARHVPPGPAVGVRRPRPARHGDSRRCRRARSSCARRSPSPGPTTGHSTATSCCATTRS